MFFSSSVSRRDVLRALGAVAAASFAPGCSDLDESVNPVPVPFLTPDELAVIGALADFVLPPDELPGGGGLGAAAYIAKMLTALDDVSVAPTWFAGGPYSGRQPFGDGKGGVSTNFPPNDFASFLPLDRVGEAAVRLFLFGSKGVPGGGPNDHVLGPVVGLRDQVKEQIDLAIKSSPTPIPTLDAAGIKNTFLGLDRDFQATFIELVCEAALSAPEYGGNLGGAGWKLVHFPGDSQPLGYSLYDATTDDYRERVDAPVTTLDPGPDPEPMDSEVRGLIESIAKLQGGKVFK